MKKSELTATRQLFGDATKIPPRADSSVELRAVLTEVRHVLSFHHPNTHKTLRDRISKCLERLKP